MQVITLLKTIPSRSHNAPFSDEHGQHWPAGQQFEALSAAEQRHMRQSYRLSATSFALRQVGGEEVILVIDHAKLPELFGIPAPGSLATAINRNRASKDVKLSSGRTIRHTPMANGAQDAIPTTGPAEMTEAEFGEYVQAIRDKHFR